jgi:hypothetical protein
MSLFPPSKLSDQEKLEILRRLDQFRKWHSLDEQRYCLACARIITGHEIQVIGRERGTGPLRVICPTRNCHSIPIDWVLPTDDVLAKINAPAQRRNITAAQSHAMSNSISTRMRRFAGRSKRIF